MPHTANPLRCFNDLVQGVRANQTRRGVSPTRAFPPVRAGGRTCFTPQEVFMAYVPGPQHEVSPDIWAEIGSFVRQCVSKATCESPATAKTRMSYAAAFVGWCHRHDVPLRAEAVFTPERVEAYAFSALKGRPPRSVAAIRGALRTIGFACTKKAPWSRPPTALRKNAYLAAPYTPEEIEGYWACTDAQATPRRQHIFQLLLAAGLGAGLSSRETFELHASDILTHPEHDQLRIIVLPDRMVPLRAGFTTIMDEACARVPDGRLVGGRVSDAATVKDPLAKFRTPLDIPASLPRLSMSRLRTTWAVTVLSTPITITEFHQVAGTTSAKSLELYAQYVHVRDEAEWMCAAAGI